MGRVEGAGWISVEVRVAVEETALPDIGGLVEQLLRRHWEVSAPEAARLLGLRADELAAKLRRATGMNYRQFRQDIRLRVAAGLLRSGALSVEQVAQAVGYACRETLDRTFTRKVGDQTNVALATLVNSNILGRAPRRRRSLGCRRIERYRNGVLQFSFTTQAAGSAPADETSIFRVP